MFLPALALFLIPAWLGLSLLRVSGRGPAVLILAPLMLFWSLMVTLGSGLPLTIPNVGGMQLLTTAIMLIFLMRRRLLRTVLPKKPAFSIPRGHLWLIGAIALMILGALMFRSWIQPLMGLDCPVRWNLLARRMLELKNLDFYPPLSSEDFRIYTFPDSISPILSGVYWWFYAAVGAVDERLSSVFIVLQGIVIAAFVFLLSRRMASSRAAFFAVGVLAAAPLAFSSLVIGQETGLLSIAILGSMYYLASGEDEDLEWPSVFVAGLSVALGALAREYGWALLPFGLLLLRRRRATARLYVLFFLTVVVLAGPWYLRTWILSGNPLYPLSVAGLFPVNPVYSAYLAENSRFHGVMTYSLGNWLKLVGMVLHQAPLQFLALIFCLFLRRCRSLLWGAGLFTGLWILSIGYTLGGVEYSMRVLGPAVALLSVGAGISIDRWVSRKVGSRGFSSKRLQWGVSIGIAALMLRALVFDALYPRSPNSLPPGRWFRAAVEHQEYQYRCESIERECSRYFPAGVGILNYDAYSHAGLMDSVNPSILVWSPEMGLLFDPELDGTEIRHALMQKGVGGVIYFPPGRHSPLLELSSFFRRDRENWIPLAAVSGSVVLYGFPRETGNMAAFPVGK